MPHIEVVARALITSGSRVLLCRCVRDGYYYLPGGHVEHGEAAAAAALRELQEEGAIEAVAGECLLVHENVFEARGRTHHELNVVFRVTLVDEQAPIVSQEEKIDLEWVDLASVVDLDLRPDAIKAWLASGAAPIPWISTMG